MDYKEQETYQRLTKDYGLDVEVVDALCDEDTRPRFFIHNDGIVLIIRGINYNAGSDPDDMISLRMWIDAEKIITLEHRNIKAINSLAQKLENGRGPKTTMQCLLELSNAIADEISEVIEDISDRTDALEEDVIDTDALSDFDLREKLSALRREIISIRRYLSPQKEIFQNMQNEKFPLITIKAKTNLREISNNFTKNIEDLDYARDHIAVYYEELQSKMSINMSRIMYMISIVTVIFLPLGLITSLLGINVAGIPFAESDHAFLVVCGLLAFLCLILVTLMRKLRWF